MPRAMAVRIGVFNSSSRPDLGTGMPATTGHTLSNLERALVIAALAHAGQKDKGGEPYILHPLRMMLKLDSDEERQVALLHDVLEDTDVTLQALEEAGFAADILEAVQVLTRQPDETRMAAAQRAAGNPLALKVKLADNADNLNLKRLPEPDEQDLARLKEYRAVRRFLLRVAAEQKAEAGE